MAAAANEVTIDRIPQAEILAGQEATFFAVCCCGCGNVTGRMYTSGPPAMAATLNRFAFVPDKVTSYALGSAGIKAAAASIEPSEHPSSTLQPLPPLQQEQQQEEHRQLSSLAAEHEELRQRLEVQQDYITKVGPRILVGLWGHGAAPKCWLWWLHGAPPPIMARPPPPWCAAAADVCST